MRLRGKPEGGARCCWSKKGMTGGSRLSVLLEVFEVSELSEVSLVGLAFARLMRGRSRWWYGWREEEATASSITVEPMDRERW